MGVHFSSEYGAFLQSHSFAFEIYHLCVNSKDNFILLCCWMLHPAEKGDLRRFFSDHFYCEQFLQKFCLFVFDSYNLYLRSVVPTQTEKPRKMTDAFAVRERSRIFQLEQKVTESWVS